MELSTRNPADTALALNEPHIVLTWLTRMRWLAVAGQLTATAVATLLLIISLLGSMAAMLVAGVTWWRSGDATSEIDRRIEPSPTNVLALFVTVTCAATALVVRVLASGDVTLWDITLPALVLGLGVSSARYLLDRRRQVAAGRLFTVAGAVAMFVGILDGLVVSA